jgi:hypothetical protein
VSETTMYTLGRGRCCQQQWYRHSVGELLVRVGEMTSGSMQRFKRRAIEAGTAAASYLISLEPTGIRPRPRPSSSPPRHHARRKMRCARGMFSMAFQRPPLFSHHKS